MRKPQTVKLGTHTHTRTHAHTHTHIIEHYLYNRESACMGLMSGFLIGINSINYRVASNDFMVHMVFIDLITHKGQSHGIVYNIRN